MCFWVHLRVECACGIGVVPAPALRQAVSDAGMIPHTHAPHQPFHTDMHPPTLQPPTRTQPPPTHTHITAVTTTRPTKGLHFAGCLCAGLGKRSGADAAMGSLNTEATPLMRPKLRDRGEPLSLLAATMCTLRVVFPIALCSLFYRPWPGLLGLHLALVGLQCGVGLVAVCRAATTRRPWSLALVTRVLGGCQPRNPGPSGPSGSSVREG